uniref:Secreted protein n=1 Tax=Parascaris univalens TaxID=6257 RepID=A0A914ZPC4_PARUN
MTRLCCVFLSIVFMHISRAAYSNLELMRLLPNTREATRYPYSFWGVQWFVQEPSSRRILSCEDSFGLLLCIILTLFKLNQINRKGSTINEEIGRQLTTMVTSPWKSALRLSYTMFNAQYSRLKIIRAHHFANSALHEDGISGKSQTRIERLSHENRSF